MKGQYTYYIRPSEHLFFFKCDVITKVIFLDFDNFFKFMINSKNILFNVYRTYKSLGLKMNKYTMVKAKVVNEIITVASAQNKNNFYSRQYLAPATVWRKAGALTEHLSDSMRLECRPVYVFFWGGACDRNYMWPCGIYR